MDGLFLDVRDGSVLDHFILEAIFSTLISAMGGWCRGVVRGVLPLLAAGGYPGPTFSLVTLGRPALLLPCIHNLTSAPRLHISKFCILFVLFNKTGLVFDVVATYQANLFFYSSASFYVRFVSDLKIRKVAELNFEGTKK